jgi:two-component system chemotaxis response regulator CheY
MISRDKFNPTRPVSVFIVDDDLMMRKVLRLIVHEMGFNVAAEASSGDAVMSVINEQPPDMVLLDINLPGTDGLDLLPRILAEHPYIKVVMISSETSQDKVKGAIENGAVDFIAKPFDPDAVMLKLKRFMPEEDSQPA